MWHATKLLPSIVDITWLELLSIETGPSCRLSAGGPLLLIQLWHAAAAGTVVAVSCGILVVLFLIQRNGTSKIGYAFSPIMLAFLLFNSGVGAYNIGKYGVSVFKVVLTA